MEHIPDFRNLYPHSLLPMGINDLNNLLKQDHSDRMVEAANWLTAYVWHDGINQYGWKVIVYPARKNGSFIGMEPYFMSRSPGTYDHVKNTMKLVEIHITNDTMTTNPTFEEC